jgi:valyl-tRNA synthetase
MPMEKTFDAAEAEPRISAASGEAGAFRAGANARQRPETFCIMIPPPNVTGALHMGHAFNNTLQDILTRWHRMRGFDTLWQPGTDHAGIATQMVTERELAKEGKPPPRDGARGLHRPRLAAEGQVARQHLRSAEAPRRLLRLEPRGLHHVGRPRGAGRRGGQLPRRRHPVFVDLYDKGLIYRGKRLVNWDPHFETAISDLEVEQVEVEGHMWRLRYPLENGETYEHPTAFDEDGNPTEWETRDYLTVATTRPETMLGDTGVAVHPDDRRYAHLVGKTVRLPLVGRPRSPSSPTPTPTPRRAPARSRSPPRMTSTTGAWASARASARST